MSLKEIDLNDPSSNGGGYSPSFNGNRKIVRMVLEKHDEVDDEDHMDHHDEHPLVGATCVSYPNGAPPNSDLYFPSNNNSNNSNTASKFNKSVKFDDPMPSMAISTPLNAPDGGYGWVIVFVAFFVSVLTDGALYSFGIFMPVYIKDFNSTSATVSWVGSFGAGTTCILSLYAGHYADKYGNNKILFVGAVIASLGYLFASFSTELWHLFLTQGLICGIGFSLSYTSALSVVGQWFTKRRGLALGLSVCGSGLGVFIMVNIIGKLLDSYGWQTTLRYLALIEIVGLSLCAFLVKRLLPLTAEGGMSIMDTAKEYFKDKHFFYLYMGYVLAVFGLGMGGHLPNYCILHGLSNTQARFVLSMNGVASALGRIMIGYIADHLGKLLVLRICMLTASAITFCWIGFTSFPLILFYSMVMGFNVGGCFSLLPSICAELFGVNNLGSLLGLMYTAFAWGNIFAMPMSGWLFLIQNSYEIPIAVCGVFFFCAAVCVDYMCEATSLVHLKTMSVIPHHDISQKVYITQNYMQQSQHGSNSGGSVHGDNNNFNDYENGINSSSNSGTSGMSLTRPRNMSALSTMSGYSSGVGGGITPSSSAAAKISQRQRMNSTTSQTSERSASGQPYSLTTAFVPPPSPRQPDKNSSLIKAMSSTKAAETVKTAMISIKERARSVSNASISSAASISNIQLFNSNNAGSGSGSPMAVDTRSRMNSVSSNHGGGLNLNMPTIPVSSMHGSSSAGTGLRVPLSMTPTAISNRMKHAYSFTQQHDPDSDMTIGIKGGNAGNDDVSDDYTTVINFNDNSNSNNISSKKSSNNSNSDKNNRNNNTNNNNINSDDDGDKYSNNYPPSPMSRNYNNQNSSFTVPSSSSSMTDRDIVAEMTQSLNNGPSSSSLYNSSSSSATSTPRSNIESEHKSNNIDASDGSYNNTMTNIASSSSHKRSGSIYGNNNYNDDGINSSTRLPPIRESVSESVSDSQSRPSTTTTPSHSASQSQQTVPLAAAALLPPPSRNPVSSQPSVTESGAGGDSSGSVKDANGNAILFYDENLFDESDKRI